MMNVPNLEYYKVKEGQTLSAIARHFSCPERLIVKENGLTKEVRAGQILRLPKERRHLYTAQEGDGKKLISGEESRYDTANGASSPYPGQQVYL